MSKKAKPPKKKKASLACCKQCGRDTANKGRICSACLNGHAQVNAPSLPAEAEAETHYYFGGEEWMGPLEDE